ncbi:hypothetical protein V1478_004734 [Vespula squamosa]|uniref:Uncharacterized protein n=1 Tax=Vespula squamosa TaxID=30214 RepID=A0ABD2BH10_VESSQ
MLDLISFLKKAMAQTTTIETVTVTRPLKMEVRSGNKEKKRRKQEEKETGKVEDWGQVVMGLGGA